MANDAPVSSLTFNAHTTDVTVPITDVPVKFYSNDGSAVGTELFSANLGTAAQRVVGGEGCHPFTDFSVRLPGVMLVAGDYFLGLQVGPTQDNMHPSVPFDAPADVRGSDESSHHSSSG